MKLKVVDLSYVTFRYELTDKRDEGRTEKINRKWFIKLQGFIIIRKNGKVLNSKCDTFYFNAFIKLLPFIKLVFSL